MSNGKHGLRALGLAFLAAMGLMAFMAAGAQAEAWDVSGKLLVEPLLPELDGIFKAGQEGLLLTTTGAGVAIVIHCKEFTVNEGKLHLTDATGKLTYVNSSCLTLVGGANSKNCGGEVAGGINILPASALITPVLHSGHVLLLAKPLAGETFTQIHYGPLCSLPLASIKGTVAFECEDGSLKLRSCESSQVRQLIKPAAPSLLGDKLIYGANEATLHGEIEVFLKGTHAGLPFNAL